MTEASPLATFARDGWSLLDVERAHRARDGVYWVPPAALRRGLVPGTFARLLFAWADPGPDDPGREKLWVEVEHAAGGVFRGRLVNEPAADAPVSGGDALTFEPRHVLDLFTRGETPLSTRSGLVECRDHGFSEPAMVCLHLARGAGLGFHAPGRGLRPQAACDACAARGVPEPDGLAVVCGGCWDRIRGRNAR